MMAGCQIQCAANLAGAVLNGLSGQFHVRQYPSGDWEQALTGVRELDAPADAIKQSVAQLGFEGL